MPLSVEMLARKALYEEEQKRKRAEEAERKAEQAASTVPSMRERTVSMNRERAENDTSYTPAGVSRQSYDNLRSGRLKTAVSEKLGEEIPETRKNAVKRRQNGLISNENTKEVKKTSAYQSRARNFKAAQPLPVVKSSEQTSPFAEDVAKRKKQAQKLPVIQTDAEKALGLPGTKRAYGSDIFKSNSLHALPYYPELEDATQTELAEYANKINKAQMHFENPNLDPTYTDEQARADLEKYTKLYKDTEAYWNELKAERKNERTYVLNAKTDSEFKSAVSEGNKKDNIVKKSEAMADKLLGESVYSPHGDDSSANAKYLMMSQEEKDVYNYYIGKNDTRSAELYLKALEPELDKRLGAELSERITRDTNAARQTYNILKSSARAGWDTGTRGIAQVFQNDLLEPTAVQQTYSQTRPHVDNVRGAAADLLFNVGNMTPGVAASTVASFIPGIGSAAASAIGASVLGTSAAGSAYSEAMREGKSEEESIRYGVLEGIKESALDFVFGKAGELGGAAMSKLLSKIPALQTVKNSVSSVLGKLSKNQSAKAAFKASGKYAANAADEGFTEYLQEILEPVVRNMAFNENNEFTPFSEEALYAAAMGAATAGILNAPYIAADYKNAKAEYMSAQPLPVKPQSAAQPLPAAPQNKIALSDMFKSDDIIHVGQATTIYGPYKGTVPQKKADFVPKVVTLGQNSVNKAQDNIAYATMSSVKNPRSALKEIYNKWYDARKGNNTITVDGITYKNRPYNVELSKRVVGKVISDPNMSAEKIAVFDAIDDIIKNGEYVGSANYTQKGNKKKLTERFDYFETNANIGGNDFVVAFDVEVFPGANNYRTHKVINKMELKAMTGADVTAPAAVTDAGSVPTAAAKGSTPINIISQPLPTVKQRSESISNTENTEPRETTKDSLIGWVNDKIEEQNEAYIKRAEESQNITYLTKTPKNKKSVQRQLKDFKSEFRRKLVDSGDAVREVGKTMHDSHLYAYYNNARQSQAAGQNMVTKAQTNIRGEKIGKSLDEIFKPIKERGEKYLGDFTEFLLYRHNIDRINAGVPIYFSKDLNSTLRESKEIVNTHLRNHPEFEKLAEDVYTFNRNLLQYKVDSGLITKKFADEINAKYPHYVPTHRTIDDDYYAIDTIAEEIARIGTGIQTAKGSNRDILPIYDQMSKMAVQTVSQAKRGIFANRLAALAYNDPVAMSLYTGMPKDADGIYNLDDLKGDSLKENLLVYRRNGKTEVMELSRPMMEAVRELSNQGRETTTMEKGFRKINKAFKSLITEYNPLFTIRNFARDIPDALFASKNTAAFLRYLPEATNEMRKGGELWQQFEALGGTASSLFDYDYNSGTFKQSSWLKKNTLDRISELNRFVEMIPRFAEFYATVKKGDGSYSNLMDAMHNAADITVNFQRGGSWVKPLNSTLFPYLNASVQGLDKNIRNFTETSGLRNWTRLIVKAAVFGFAPSVINEFLLGDDEEYKELRSHDKLDNYIIKIGENSFIKVPGGRLTKSIGNLGAATVRALRGGEVDIGELALNIASQVGPVNPLESNLFMPIINTAKNRTWYGGEIENKRLQSLPVAERYDSSTSEISKWVGKVLNVSPKKVDTLIDSYTGVIGDTVLPIFTNPESDNVEPADKAKGLAYKTLVKPWENKFFINGNISNNISSKFYERQQALTQAANSSNGGRADEVTARYFNAQNKGLSKLYDEMRMVESDSGLDYFTKQAEIEKIQKDINHIQRTALQTEQKYSAAAKKYELKNSDVAYLLTNKDVFGSERALEYAGDVVYEAAQKAVSKGADYDAYVDYQRRIWELPDYIRHDTKKYNDEKSKIIREVNWKNKDKYVLATMSESKQKKYPQIKASFKTLSVVRYHEIVEGYNEIKGVKGANGKTISGSKKANQIKYLQSVGFNYSGAVLFRNIMEKN